METQGGLSGGWRFLRDVALIDVAIFLIVGLVCWTGGWRTAYQYGGGLFWAGLVVIMIGTASVRARSGTSLRPEYEYGMTASGQSAHERLRQRLADAADGNRFFFLMLAPALVSMVVGSVIQTVFR